VRGPGILWLPCNSNTAILYAYYVNMFFAVAEWPHAGPEAEDWD